MESALLPLEQVIDLVGPAPDQVRKKPVCRSAIQNEPSAMSERLLQLMPRQHRNVSDVVLAPDPQFQSRGIDRLFANDRLLTLYVTPQQLTT